MRPVILWGDNAQNHASGGRKVVHKLYEDLKSKNVEIYLTNKKDGLSIDPEKAIAIYTDRVSGNPLDAGKVVRWMLHKKDHFDTTPRDYTHTDAQVWASRILCPTASSIMLPPVFEMDKLVYPDNADPTDPRWEIAVYVGKGKQTRAIHESSYLITRQWPETRDHLINVLQTIDMLVCFDPLTILTHEATLCGAIAVQMPNNEFTPDEYRKYGMTTCGIAFDDSFEEIQRARKTLPDARSEIEKHIAGYADQLESFISLLNRLS